MNEINIKVIPHNEQRYETVGDYFRDEKGVMQIRVSEMSDKRYAFLVMIHEVAEVMLTETRGISEFDILAFDESFEANRIEGNIEEPGDEPDAPYVDEHCIATAIERLMCAALGIKWKKYDEECNLLSQHKEEA